MTLIDISKIMQKVKDYRTEQNKIKIENDPRIGRERLIDHNKIELILIMHFMLKTIKLFIIIFSFSFFSALLFKVLLEIEIDLWGEDEDYINGDCSESWGGYFTRCYGLEDMTAFETTVLLVYFSFTSLSTVGFGDFNPKSNLERMFIAFFLLFGVAIFSYIMGIFLEILSQFKALNADLDQGEELNVFMTCLKKFNGNMEIDLEFQKQMEHFFEHKWIMDKNFAFNLSEFETVTE